MKRWFSLGFLLIYLVNTSVWAKSSGASVEVKISTKKAHKKKTKKPKNSKSSKSGKSGAEFKVESQINKKDVTFDFNDGKDQVKVKHSGKKE